MKVTLKDYQVDATREVLANLRKARKRWHADHEPQAFSLSAATGSGKTVVAAAVIEALFRGNDSYGFDADPGAAVLWFSDSPSLNEQTKFRLLQASDGLRHSDLVVVGFPFNQPRFEAGKVYFLNTQKLGKKSKLVKGFEEQGDDAQVSLEGTRPDLQANSIWEIIRNTVEDPNLTLYLVLDEAHRGMGRPTASEAEERTTLVKRLINGERGIPGIPVVWGISATVERFDQTMQVATGRAKLPTIKVDSKRVQESGLLKDTLALEIPEEVGSFDTVLLRRGTSKLKEITDEWRKYAEAQGGEAAVTPLMVLQIPNQPDSDEVGRWLQVIFDEWGDLNEGCVAHVLADHSEQQYGGFPIPWIQPERVQDANWVKVLIAKDAVSTGWDCPRAEVLVSFRPAKDETYITQLLGRMIRTPLARRIPGNEKLNSVNCLLPKFDRAAVDRVVAALTQGGGEIAPYGKVLVNPAELRPNPEAPKALWARFESLPSQARPQLGARPVHRLTALAGELAMDGLRVNAGREAHDAIHRVLDVFAAGHKQAIERARKMISTVQGKTILVDVPAGLSSDSSFKADADLAVYDDAFRRAERILGKQIARSYSRHLAERDPDFNADPEEALLEAREVIGAMALLAGLRELVDESAQVLAKDWLKEHRDAIKALPDERSETYRELTAMSREAEDVSLVKPGSRMEMTALQDGRTVRKWPTYPKHLLCDDQGNYPADLNDWEVAVLRAEMARQEFRFWYRNPSRPAQDSLGLAYEGAEGPEILRPDFLLFSEVKKKWVVDIVDPHGTHLADALPKLKGLAAYVDEHPDVYRRVAAVAELDGGLRMLDFAQAHVRDAVRSASSAEWAYKKAGKAYL